MTTNIEISKQIFTAGCALKLSTHGIQLITFVGSKTMNELTRELSVDSHPGVIEAGDGNRYYRSCVVDSGIDGHGSITIRIKDMTPAMKRNLNEQ